MTETEAEKPRKDFDTKALVEHMLRRWDKCGQAETVGGTRFIYDRVHAFAREGLGRMAVRDVAAGLIHCTVSVVSQMLGHLGIECSFGNGLG